jgi:hypothetical protein
MENGIEEKKKNSHPNRVLLSKEALMRVDGWMEQVQKSFKAIKLSRADIVNHLLLARSPHMTESEIEKLGTIHFDEVRFTTWALQALKEAKARGESTTLAHLINTYGSKSLLPGPAFPTPADKPA